MSEHTSVLQVVRIMSDESEISKKYNLMIPSDTSKVTVENLWRIISAITKIGRTFQREDIARHPDSPFTDKIAIGRFLSYLKYLGIINESRERVEKKEGKFQFVQKFSITDTASKFYYLLQDGRKEAAMAEWSNIIREQDLYRVITSELFSQTKKITIRELQDIIWKAYGGKHLSSFYRNGAEFIAELLSHAGLVEFDRSSGLISQKEYFAEEDMPLKLDIEHPTKVAGPPIGPDFVEFSYEGLYLKIKPDETRIGLAKGILNLLEKELQTGKEAGKAEGDKTS